MNQSNGKIYDEEHLVRALRWSRPKLVAKLLGSAAACAVLAAASFYCGIWTGGPAFIAWWVAVWYFVSLVRLERKLEALE